jgi:hypothetical protein
MVRARVDRVSVGMETLLLPVIDGAWDVEDCILLVLIVFAWF